MPQPSLCVFLEERLGVGGSIVAVVMGRIFVVIYDNVEERLRLAVVRGGKRGELSSTMEETSEYWLKKHSHQIKHVPKRISQPRTFNAMIYQSFRLD